MKEVVLTPKKREELTAWLMEQPAKFANPVLQFLAENEVEEADPAPLKPIA